MYADESIATRPATRLWILLFVARVISPSIVIKCYYTAKTTGWVRRMLFVEGRIQMEDLIILRHVFNVIE
ncbi:hypothetical protein NCCP2331_30890 [Sporosarcina sp. NCCP-2331]|nr:hypothetical protein NCCP2331_30890 [Sporosarcina sp. NCCP-2331]GLB57231.1 hypothetical protein NCCP2378_30190 [Sporosarcina sp. NCCP-2378]